MFHWLRRTLAWARGRRAPHRLGDWLSVLRPRVLIAFGIEEARVEGGAAHLYLVGAAGAPEQATAAIERFFALPRNKLAGMRRGRRPAFFDVAVIAADWPLSARRLLLERLQPLAHARSVVILLAPDGPALARRRRLRGRQRSLERIAGGLQVARSAGGDPALLLAGLDRARIARRVERIAQEPVSRRQRLSVLLARHADPAPAPAPAGALKGIADAPAYPASMLEPGYEEIGQGADAFVERSRSGRSLGRWWGATLRAPAVAVREGEQVGFVRSGGANRGALVGRDGRLLDTSHRRRFGFDAEGSGELYNPEAILIGADGRRHPPADAAALLRGPLLPGGHVLLGVLEHHFGHFLTEGLARAWALPWAIERGLRVLAWGELKRFHLDALALLGVERAHIDLAEPGTVVERLAIPDPALRLLGSISPAMADCWRRMASTALAGAPDRKDGSRFLYLSRRGVNNRSLVNEEELEALLATLGGRIVRPETLPFAEQVGIVAEAPVVVGCSGSQLHLSMFQRPGSAKLVIAGEQFVGPDETAIAAANRTRVAHYLEPVPTARGSMRAEWRLDVARFRDPFRRWLDRNARP